MRQFSVIGSVLIRGENVSLAVENATALLKFWDQESVDTDLDYIWDNDRKRPKLSLRGPFAAKCIVDDHVKYTIESVSRSNGKTQIRGIKIEVLKRAVS
jgi:hypothetical protein